jgi:hypothetical protein
MTRNRWGTHLHGATAWVASRPPEPAASVHLFICSSVHLFICSSVHLFIRPSVRPARRPAHQEPHALKIVQLLQDFQGCWLS